MRREVLELLAFADVEAHPLDAWKLDTSELQQALETSLGPWPDPAPAAIGPYRVLGLLGAGSMSTVFLGEREHPPGKVAIKVLRPWLVAGEALRRFELEVEILAGLEHPRIARILDAGRADLGSGLHPYLVLEHIEGLPLDAWVQKHEPDPRARLALFLAICAGVAHAHARGVVHRDLKPGNVLVDERGEPHLLDFGVARLPREDPRATRLLTAVGQLVGTLEYMSPEQAAGRSEDVDTRSDVYALGVILYELLAGKRPLELDGLALPECLRRIASVEALPLRASDRHIPADLETIVAKALEKDRGRRYATVHELARDVERFLAHEPISARPPSSLYVVRKYARRHPAVAAAVCVGCAAGLAAAAGIALGWREARAQAQLAREHLAEARDAVDESHRVAEVLARVIVAPDPTEEGRNVLLRDVVLDLGGEIEARLPEHPRGRGYLRHYLALSLQSLGEHAAALAQAEAAVADMRLAGVPDAELLQLTRKVRGELLNVLGRGAEARDELSLLHAELVQERGEEDPLAVDVLVELAVVLGNLPDLPAAEAAHERALELRRRIDGEDAPKTLGAEVDLLSLRVQQGRYQEALEALPALLPRLRELHSDKQDYLVSPLSALAKALAETGAFAEALSVRREQLALCESFYGPDHFMTLDARTDLMEPLLRLGLQEEGLAVALACDASAAQQLGNDHHLKLRIKQFVGIFLGNDGRLEEAQAALQAALDIGLRIRPVLSQGNLDLRYELANMLGAQGKLEQAIAAYEGLDADLADRPPEDSLRLLVTDGRARTLIAGGHVEEGLALGREVLELKLSQTGPADPFVALFALGLADQLAHEGRWLELAEILLPIEAPLVAAARAGPDDLRDLAAQVLVLRGLAHAGLGAMDEADGAEAEAGELMASMSPELVSSYLKHLKGELEERLRGGSDPSAQLPFE